MPIIRALFLFLTCSVFAAEPVPIGNTHQLFLDGHLIEHTEHFTLRVQEAWKDGANPLIVPRAKWKPVGNRLPGILRTKPFIHDGGGQFSLEASFTSAGQPFDSNEEVNHSPTHHRYSWRDAPSFAERR